MVIYEAFVEGKLEAPRHLARTVHDHYFEPKYEEFQSRTIWSLSNAFTSAFQELEPIPQFKVTAKLGEFLEARFLQPELLCRAHHCVPHFLRYTVVRFSGLHRSTCRCCPASRNCVL